MNRLLLAALLAASPLALASSDPCPPGAAIRAEMEDGYTRTVSNAQRVKTASKTANDAIHRCIKLLSQYKLGMTYEFPSAEAVSAAAIAVVVDRACQEVYKAVQSELVKHDPKGFVTTGKNFDIGAIFGEYLETKYPSTGSALVSDVIAESDRDMRAGGFVNAGEFLRRANADPASIARANQVTENWLQRYTPKRDGYKGYQQSAAPAPAPKTNSFWSWNGSDFKQ